MAALKEKLRQSPCRVYAWPALFAQARGNDRLGGGYDALWLDQSTKA